jgi:hypothetical protein
LPQSDLLVPGGAKTSLLLSNSIDHPNSLSAGQLVSLKNASSHEGSASLAASNLAAIVPDAVLSWPILAPPRKRLLRSACAPAGLPPLPAPLAPADLFALPMPAAAVASAGNSSRLSPCEVALNAIRPIEAARFAMTVALHG